MRPADGSAPTSSTATASTVASRSCSPTTPSSRHLDLAALDLRAFDPGALVRIDGSFHRIVDPFRSPSPACAAPSPRSARSPTSSGSPGCAGAC